MNRGVNIMILKKVITDINNYYKNLLYIISINPRKSYLYNLIIFIGLVEFFVPVLSGTLWAITEILWSKEIPEPLVRLLFRFISFILILYFVQSRRKINESNCEKNEISSFSDLMEISKILDIN